MSKREQNSFHSTIKKIHTHTYNWDNIWWNVAQSTKQNNFNIIFVDLSLRCSFIHVERERNHNINEWWWINSRNFLSPCLFVLVRNVKGLAKKARVLIVCCRVRVLMEMTEWIYFKNRRRKNYFIIHALRH